MAKPKWEINCYEAYKDGSLGIHIEDMNPKTAVGDGCMEIRIPAHDVSRLMYGAIDALKKEPSRR